VKSATHPKANGAGRIGGAARASAAARANGTAREMLNPRAI